MYLGALNSKTTFVTVNLRRLLISLFWVFIQKQPLLLLIQDLEKNKVIEKWIQKQPLLLLISPNPSPKVSLLAIQKQPLLLLILIL